MFLLDQEMRIHMAVKAVGHFLMHSRGMGQSVAGLALRDIRMLSPVAEGAGKRLVLGDGFLQFFPLLFMTGDAEGPWRGQGRVDLQRMVRGMAPETVTGYLAFNMRLVALGAVRNLAVDIMTEGAGLLCMGTFVISKILARTLMAGEAGFLDIIGKVQGQGFMGIGVAGQAVFKLKMRPSFMTH